MKVALREWSERVVSVGELGAHLRAKLCSYLCTKSTAGISLWTTSQPRTAEVRSMNTWVKRQTADAYDQTPRNLSE